MIVMMFSRFTTTLKSNHRRAGLSPAFLCLRFADCSAAKGEERLSRHGFPVLTDLGTVSQAERVFCAESQLPGQRADSRRIKKSQPQ